MPCPMELISWMLTCMWNEAPAEKSQGDLIKGLVLSKTEGETIFLLNCRPRKRKSEFPGQSPPEEKLPEREVNQHNGAGPQSPGCSQTQSLVQTWTCAFIPRETAEASDQRREGFCAGRRGCWQLCGDTDVGSEGVHNWGIQLFPLGCST